MLPGSTPTLARFRSNLLGSLGAGVFVGPNTINFNTVFNNLDQTLVEVCCVISKLDQMLVEVCCVIVNLDQSLVEV